MSEWDFLIQLLRNKRRANSINLLNLYDMIRKNDLETLFYNYFEKKDKSIANKIYKEMQLNKLYYEILYQETKNLFSILNNNKIPYVIIKGLFFALKSYGDIKKRSSSDIDILVDKQYYNQLKKVLIDTGFVQGYAHNGDIACFSSNDIFFYLLNTHQAAPYIKKSSNESVPYINIDVNLRINWGESSDINVETSDLIEDHVSMNYNGLDYPVLNNEKALLAYCLSVYKDNNSIYLLMKNKGYTIRPLCDIYYFIQNNDIDKRQFCNLINKYNTAKHTREILFLTAYIFDDYMMLESFGFTKTQPSSLKYFGLTKEEKTYWNIDFIERFKQSNLNDCICNLLSDKDLEKIAINDKHIFL